MVFVILQQTPLHATGTAVTVVRRPAHFPNVVQMVTSVWTPVSRKNGRVVILHGVVMDIVTALATQLHVRGTVETAVSQLV